MENKRMNDLCIYHKACTDGFGAALVVRMYKGEQCEFLAAQYGDEAPDVTGKDVVIVDFSYPREVLLKMYEQAESLIVLDHHRTAKEALAGLDFCIFDMERSGAMMAWDYFYPNVSAPDIIKHIQDRDLWKWELEGTAEVSAGLRLLPNDFDTWLPFMNDSHDKFAILMEKGRTVLEYQDLEIKRALDPSKWGTVEVGGYQVPITNCTHLTSEICGAMAEDKPFAVVYFDTAEERVYSLRSRGENPVDVGAIAKEYGGGGHHCAAGFKLPLDKCLKVY
jgi:oligoribonuclease NrnB/cAMP/cGMP phosphodiesterase (DHH superfamily)